MHPQRSCHIDYLSLSPNGEGEEVYRVTSISYVYHASGIGSTPYGRKYGLQCSKEQ